ETVPGRVIVVAAGNDGSEDLHASGELARRGSVVVPLEVAFYRVPLGAGLRVSFGWEIWYPPASGELTVRVISPSGRSFGPVALHDAKDWDGPDGHLFVDHAFAGVDPASSRAGIYCSVQQSDALPAWGRWLVVLEGSAHFDLWVTPGSIPAAVEVRGELDAD